MRRGVFLLSITGLALFLWALPILIPAVGAWLAPDIVFRGDSRRRVIYLTIDDSPSTVTLRILETLRRHQVRAVFFVTASRVHNVGQLTDLIREGHALGHHMRTGQSAASLAFDAFTADFDHTEQLLQSVSKVRLYRPPSGTATPEQLQYVKQKGYTAVLGSVFPFDHWLQNPHLLARLCRYLAVPGGIVILHDGNQRGLVTTQVLELLIPALKASGYEFELLGQVEG
jgi:peptidoglycan-N-acetylglucosamine deacetylase